MMNKNLISALGCLMFLMVSETGRGADAGELLPRDPQVRVGRLENGIRYYIRQNSRPESKVELRLVVNAGSLQEDEAQRGVAHFVEHMAFNGTKSYAKNELVEYLQKIGVEFGADLNAYTSFDETVYMLPIPSDDPALLEQGLNILFEWAHGVVFDGGEIDKERGVVLEEWRLGLGASQRLRDQYFPTLFKDSRYADRIPIGLKSVIETANHETIRRFYREWYRPDLMAVVAVGDADPEALEKQIQTLFSRIEAVENPRPRVQFEVPSHEKTLFTIAKDKEMPYTQVQLVYKLSGESKSTLGDYRKGLLKELYTLMMNQRLEEIRLKADAPFVAGGSVFTDLVRTQPAYLGYVIVPENGIEKGLKALLEETERVRKFGFTSGELERARKDLVKQYEQSFKERQKTESGLYAEEYIRAFLTGEPFPGIEWEYSFVQQITPNIQVEEVNALSGDLSGEANRVVLVVGPEKEGIDYPGESTLRAWMEEAAASDLVAYDDGASAVSLMETEPSPGKVIQAEEISELGVTQWVLSNGMNVYLKPTPFKDDEILISAISRGGTSVYEEMDHWAAEMASAVMGQSGVADFSALTLRKVLAGKAVMISPFIADHQEGFRGSTTPDDLQEAFQLLNLYWTSSRRDPEAFSSYLRQYEVFLSNVEADPNFVYTRRLNEIMTQGHPRAKLVPSLKELREVELDRVVEIYRERFANPGDFKLLLVGNFTLEGIRPWVERYLASIPGKAGNEDYRDLGIRPPSGPVTETVRSGSDPKSRVSLIFDQEAPFESREAYLLDSLAEVVTIRLVELLREEKSGVYGVGANGGLERVPYSHATFRISFPCSPENAESLTQAALKVLQDIQMNGVTQEDLDKILETQRRHWEESLKENGFWLGRLGRYLFLNQGFEDFLNFSTYVKSLTAKDLKEAANRYIDLNRCIQVVHRPIDPNQ